MAGQSGSHEVLDRTVRIAAFHGIWRVSMLALEFVEHNSVTRTRARLGIASGDSMPKKSAVKIIVVKRLWSNSLWTVRYGRVNAGRGSTGAKRLFRVIGKKIPFEAIHAVEKYVKIKGMSRNGVYLAHASIDCPRSIGRGWIFSRLVSRHLTQHA